MSPKTTKSAPTGGNSSREGLVTPARIVVAVLGVLALVFIFENTRSTKVRLIIPEVTMPLWVALLTTALIGALCGAFAMRRRR
ncbi:LapA family protein [Streptomyces sp. NPDC005385]|uniref:LapA family protein n=1 Tax=Streptomyces sp. NPDC005385 TaxID=3157039 RepID=UPI0033ABE908